MKDTETGAISSQTVCFDDKAVPVSDVSNIISYRILNSVMQVINTFWGDVLLTMNQKDTSQNSFNCTTSQLRSKLSSNQDREKRLGRLSLQSDDTGSQNSILTFEKLSLKFS